ncbi:MAG: AAA family ATPase [Actinomycetota bacterium]
MSGQLSPTVMVACDDLVLLDEVIRHLEEIPQWRLVVSARSVDDLVHGCIAHLPDAVLLSGSLATRLAEDPDAGQLDVTLVVFGRAAEPSELRAALRLGARGYVEWPTERADLRALVEQGMRAPAVSDRPQGPLHAVWSPKGGAGASVISAHLAAAFAQQGKDCLLVDLDVDHGDQASVLDVKVEFRTIADLLSVADEITTDVARSVVWSHPSGFGTILSPGVHGAAERVSGESLGRVLGSIRQISDHVVADTPSGLSELSISVLRTAATVVMVLTPDILSLRRARAALAVLEPMGIAPERVRAVLNQHGGPYISQREVEEVLGVKGVVKVRADFEIYKAANRGQIAPAAVKALTGLSKRLAALNRPARPRIPKSLLRLSPGGRPDSPEPVSGESKVAAWTD